MTFDEYQQEAKKTAIYKKVGGHGWVYPAMELANESGEVLGKLKKVFRDEDNQQISPERLEGIKKEIGDTIWPLAMLCEELGLSFQEVAEGNIAHLKRRKTVGTLKGDGDNR